MKDKELREELKRAGILDDDSECYSNYYLRSLFSELRNNKWSGWDLKRFESGYKKLKKDNEELQNTVRALMELLNVTVVEPDKGKKLKKGNKEVSLEPKK